jgi:hypothetical protein
VEETNKPDYKNSAHSSMSPAWKIVEDVSGGTAKMRKAGTTYLPKEKGEDTESYRARLDRAVFFNGYSRTRDALVGMVCKHNPDIEEDVPQAIVKHLENIDLAGSHVDVFVKELFSDAFEGLAFILVDMQPALPPGSTKADENAAGRRPYWLKYKGCQALNWRTEVINGETVLTQITFEEISTEPQGDYGEQSVFRYRVFRLSDGVVSWMLYRKQKAAETAEEVFVEDGKGTVSGPKRIPVAVVYGNRMGMLLSSPPLLDLAYLNIAHYQELSDYREQLHALVPILVRIGVPVEVQKTLVVGPHSVADVPNDTDLKYISHDGKALEATREGLMDTEQRMALLGLSMLTQKTDASVTATEIRANNLQESSDLATMARSLQDAIETALEFHAQYLGLESGGSIKLGVAETDLALDGSTITALVSAVNSRPPLLTTETFLAILQRGFPGVELQDEIDKLKAMPGFGQTPPTPQDIAKMKGGASKILTPPAVPGPTGAQ